eukprot:jgi/Mesvir1/18440/Mv14301-RA.1
MPQDNLYAVIDIGAETSGDAAGAFVPRQPRRGNQRISIDSVKNGYSSSGSVRSDSCEDDSISSHSSVMLVAARPAACMVAEAGQASEARSLASAFQGEPGGKSTARAGRGGGMRQKNHRCGCGSSFWTRAALVLLLAASVTGTTLFVLRLYNKTIYGEARHLGQDLKEEVFALANLQVAAFINGMVAGTVALAGNLHRQGLVPLLPTDVHNAKAKMLLWETFRSLPTCDTVAYGMEQGVMAYLQPGPGPSLLVQAKPTNPDLPFGTWSGKVLPVDPIQGEPLIDAASVPEVPVTSFPQQPFYAPTLKATPGTISWWIGTAATDNDPITMAYIANTLLWVASDSNGTTEAASPEPTGTSSSTGGSGYRVIGMTGVGQSARSVTQFLSTLDLSGGRLFYSLARDGMMAFASKGKTLHVVNGTATTGRAEMSDDPIIRAAAQHLRAAFPPIPASARGKAAGNEGGDEEDDAAFAARSGLCWDEYDALIHLGGQRWYLKCQGKVYGGTEGRLAMVGVLLVPRNAIMGAIDNIRDRCQAIVLGIMAAIAVLGVLGVYLSTIYVALLAVAKRALEGHVEKQEEKIQSMAKELDMVRSLLPGGSTHALDMRTPMETLHDLLGDLAQGKALPTNETVATIQRMLKMPEPHLPILLQQSLGQRGDSHSPGPAVPGTGHVYAEGNSQVLDTDIAVWLRSTVLGMPKRHGSSPRPLQRATTLQRSESQGTDMGPSTSRQSRLSEDLLLDRIIGTMGAVTDVPAGTQPDKEAAAESKTLIGICRPLTDNTSLVGLVPSTTVEEISEAGLLQSAVAALEAPRGATQLGSQEMRVALERVGEWNFDTWSFASVSGGRPIMWMGLELYRRAGSMRAFHLPMERLVPFLAKLDEGMPGNGYHNSTHIADVANSLYHLIKYSGLAAYLSRLDILAAITAALVHDFRHPGLNNDFVVKAADELALRYNDRTVLENFHVAEAFLLMTDDNLNFLGALNAEDYKYARNVIIELVLGSDLKRHFELVEAFKKRAKDKESPLSKSNEGDRLLLMQVALKVADIGHAAKKLAIHKKWTDAITEEFYLQGDKERAAGFKVSPFMDRENNNLAKSQLGFFSFIALPLFEAWVVTFPSSKEILEEMLANIKYWEQQGEGSLRVSCSGRN